MNSRIIFAIPKNYIPSKMDSEIHITEVPMNSSRKRRLDHLSWEEKIQRKKLKNRVAAQTSRDRKKAKMDEMEYRLQALEKTNRKLSEEMRSLKELNERLLSENKELRERLGSAPVVSGAVPSGPAAGRSRPPGCQRPRSPTPPPHIADALPPLQDLIAQIDSEEYLNCLEQLADSLLREIDSEAVESASIKSENCPEERSTAQAVVGSAPKHMESDGTDSLELNILRSDADTILAQHSYAHPCRRFTKKDTCSDARDETPEVCIKSENVSIDSDTYYGTYDEENDCITVIVSSEDESIEEEIVKSDDGMDLEDDFLTDNHLCLDNKISLLSPMHGSPYSGSLSTNGSYRELASPAPTSISDFGYESVESPISDIATNDFQDLFSESFSELFPSLM